MPARCTFPPSPLHSVRLHTSTRQMPAVPLVTPHPGRPLLLKLCSPSRQAPLVIPLSSPSPAPLLDPLSALCGGSGWLVPGSTLPTRAFASGFAELTLAGEASPCSSGIRFCLLPPRASLLPATGPAQALTFLCSHPPHPSHYTHILRVGPLHPVSPSGWTLCPATPGHMSDVM